MAASGSDPGNSRTMLLDAAEALMRDSGYAAVTSRRVAAEAGLKPQLVHYYFRTMDDLFLALFRRMANDIIGRQDVVALSDRPLAAMWDILSDRRYRLLIYEFVALGNHRKAIRAEFVQFGDELRQKQMAIMQGVLARSEPSAFPWSPGFAAVLLHALARFLVLESELGVSEGHADALHVVRKFIERHDGMSQSPARRMADLERENERLKKLLGERTLLEEASGRSSPDG